MYTGLTVLQFSGLPKQANYFQNAAMQKTHAKTFIVNAPIRSE